MTRKQKQEVRQALRRYGGGSVLVRPGAASSREARDWAEVIAAALRYYDAEDPVCAKLLRLRYLDKLPEKQVIPKLYVCQTTYYTKELELLSTVAVYAAAKGLLQTGRTEKNSGVPTTGEEW